MTFFEGMDLRRVQPYALNHHGLVTLDVARRAGISDSSYYRAVDAGLLEPIYPLVARIVGTPATREQTIMAAVLGAGPGAIASHRTAAELWGVPRPDREPIDVILPSRARRATLPNVIAHRPRDYADLIPVLRRRIPTTNVLRMLCDLGACDAAALPGAVGHVLASNLATWGALDRAIARHSERGRHGIVAFRNALQDWTIDAKPAASVLELTMRRFLDAFRLPAAEFHPIIAGYEVDFRLIGTNIVIECDGWITHGMNRDQFEYDRDRDADLLAAGYTVVRVTYRSIAQRRARTAERIRRVYEQWKGVGPTVV